MYVADDNIVFIDIPKTGTRTIIKTLHDNFPGKTIGEHKYRIPPMHLHQFTFTVVRNPYDRACSMWRFVSQRAGDKFQYVKDFEDYDIPNTLNGFLTILDRKISGEYTFGRRQQRVVSSQSAFLRHNKIDTLLTLENLEEDFNNLPFVTKFIKLPHINSTTATPAGALDAKKIESDWTKIVDDTSISLINKIFWEDFERLHYEKI